MMDYDVNSHPFMKFSEAAQPEAFVKHFQQMMLAGKAFETMTVDSTRRLLEQSYQQSFKLIEEMDKQFANKNDQQQSLCFPFDLMDQMTRNMADQWSALAGLPTSASEEFAQELELARAKEAELLAQVTAREGKIEEMTLSLAKSDDDVTKATKAKQTAQRNARKAKADLEAAIETNKQLEEQVKLLEADKVAVQQDNESLIKQNAELKQQLAKLQSQLEAVSQSS
ncbi:hypothetical protein [Photobacterium rosenbergii]|uniref:hypothetical protein n=1 Tax=Photobacterium rosenbergii TaxID=294936 RepID=UPI001C9918D0|nr:hypothetical protein [Photobacterium rosenbergii]MBY5948292.1 hypothetical protein [Photobacterium rosenbergii]